MLPMSFQLPFSQSAQNTFSFSPLRQGLGSLLTLGASVHAERAVGQLDLGRAVLEVPGLLRLVVAGLAVRGE